MNNYYVMEASSNVAEYIGIREFPEEIRLACSLSGFQYIDRSILYLELDENSGNICQDIIYSEGVLLISERVKDFFDSLKIDYLFYKKNGNRAIRNRQRRILLADSAVQNRLS